MADWRKLYKSMWSDRKVLQLSRGGSRSLFTGLITVCDDDGFYDAHPAALKAAIFPGDDDMSHSDIEKWLLEIVDAGMAVIYVAQNGVDKYVELPRFKERQGIRRDRFIPSKLKARIDVNRVTTTGCHPVATVATTGCHPVAIVATTGCPKQTEQTEQTEQDKTEKKSAFSKSGSEQKKKTPAQIDNDRLVEAVRVDWLRCFRSELPYSQTQTLLAWCEERGWRPSAAMGHAAERGARNPFAYLRTMAKGSKTTEPAFDAELGSYHDWLREIDDADSPARRGGEVTTMGDVLEGQDV